MKIGGGSSPMQFTLLPAVCVASMARELEDSSGRLNFSHVEHR
jgi:hypothetical protein